MTTSEFIEKFRNDDVRKLALMGARFPDVDLTFALNQIAGWQKAREKLPAWASKEGIVYPPHISMEQCSSESTARYKAEVIKRILLENSAEAKGFSDSLVDLTGGFGVDFSYMAPCFSEAVYVERQQHLCNIAARNFQTLGLSQARVLCADGAEYLASMSPVLFAYLDPARRDSHGARTYALEDCTPNILLLKDALLDKALTTMVKLSPMVDWHQVVNSLGCVCELHIVSVKNECKELLVVLNRKKVEDVHIYCVNDNQRIDFMASEERSVASAILPSGEAITPGTMLYEPNASLMKAGCFALLCSRYGLRKVGAHSNLFLGPDLPDFPGRKFLVTAVSSMNKKELKRTLAGVAQANIAVRNFPLTAEELRKRLKMKDGGSTYIFGTTATPNNNIIFICEKA